MSFATTHVGHFRVIFPGKVPRPLLVRAKPRAFQLLWAAIEDCQRFGVAPSGNPQPLALTAWWPCTGWRLSDPWRLPKKGLNPERLAPAVTTLLNHMFGALAREGPTRTKGRAGETSERSDSAELGEGREADSIMHQSAAALLT